MFQALGLRQSKQASLLHLTSILNLMAHCHDANITKNWKKKICRLTNLQWHLNLNVRQGETRAIRNSNSPWFGIIAMYTESKLSSPVCKFCQTINKKKKHRAKTEMPVYIDASFASRADTTLSLLQHCTSCNMTRTPNKPNEFKLTNQCAICF